jgi:hypothetical protein
MTIQNISIFQLQQVLSDHLANGGEYTDRVHSLANGNLGVSRDDEVTGELPIVQQVQKEDPTYLITGVRIEDEPDNINCAVYGIVNGCECFIFTYEESAYDYDLSDFIGNTISDVIALHTRFENDYGIGKGLAVVEHACIELTTTDEGLLGTVTAILSDDQEIEILQYMIVEYSVDHFLGKTVEQVSAMHQRNEELAASLKTSSL